MYLEKSFYRYKDCSSLNSRKVVYLNIKFISPLLFQTSLKEVRWKSKKKHGITATTVHTELRRLQPDPVLLQPDPSAGEAIQTGSGNSHHCWDPDLTADLFSFFLCYLWFPPLTLTNVFKGLPAQDSWIL